MIYSGNWFLGHFPGVVGTAAEKEYRRAATENRATDFEYFYEPWQASCIFSRLGLPFLRRPYGLFP